MPKLSKKTRKVLSSKLFLFIVVLALIFLLIGLVRETYRKYQLRNEIEQLKMNIGKLEGNNQQLSDLMDSFKDSSYLEKEARIKLNLKKPGETVVVLSKDVVAGVEVVRTGSPDTQEPDEIILNSEDNETLETANYWKWWEYFFQS